MKNVLIGIGCIIAFVALLVFGYVMLFVDGKVTAKYNNTVGIEVQSSKNTMYKKSTAYIEGKARDIAQYRMQLQTEKDPAARKAIIEYIITSTSDFDIDDLQDNNLRDFVIQVRNGEVK